MLREDQERSGAKQTMMDKYNPKVIEPKWQAKWAKDKLYQTPSKSPKRKFYVLDMFPYPSAEGLHVGHFKGYAATDVIARYLRAKGYNVLHPMGWDAFGLPAENYAIKTGVHPLVSTAKNIAKIRSQMEKAGFSYDWSREINTTDPAYYRWTQWIFLKMFEKGLAYETLAPINWCPKDQTGLANEEVVGGTCERCGTKVVKKEIRQWILKITAYADRLLEDLEGLDWPQAIIEMQKNWIGKSEGTEIDFPIRGFNKKIKTVTTRADTIFGATFLALAPEHPLILELKDKIKNYSEVKNYINQTLERTEFERGLLKKEKTGVKLEGIIALNPVNNKEIPIYISDFVLITYGTGAIMSVPAHDSRDFEFAKKFNLSIISVIEKPKRKDVLAVYIYDEDNSETSSFLRKIGQPFEYITPTVRTFHINSERIPEVIKILQKSHIGTQEDYDLILKGKDFNLEINPPSVTFVSVYMEDGKHVNSDFLNGLYKDEAIKKMHDWLLKNKLGKPAVHYHLRDWVFSRQRYWGEPIPIINCKNCGTVPLPEKDLPLKLPDVKKYQPTGTGESPLAAISSWVNTTCWKCGGPAKRETNTMPQWAGSCWYYLRFIDPQNKKSLIDKNSEKYWMPVDWYVGGAEHAVLHLLYARFWHKFLYDLGVVTTAEPFAKLRNVGLVLGPNGRKMSKSRGNVVTADEIIARYGADALRLYEGFMGPFDQMISWDPSSVEGIFRFLNRVWSLVENAKFKTQNVKNKELEIAINSLIKKVEDDIVAMKFNTAIGAMMEFINLATKNQGSLTIDIMRQFVILIGPFAPHIAEELWQLLGGKYSVHFQDWPTFDKKLEKRKEITIVIQVNGRLREKIKISGTISENELKGKALTLHKIKKYLDGKGIKNVIIVPDRLVNIVTTEVDSVTSTN